MKIRNVRHRGLRRLFEEGKASGLSAQLAGNIRNILGFLQDMESAKELHAVPTWKAHQLAGGRKGTWSLFVSKNWRITFRIDEAEIIDLDYEDYH